jgi:hypothetical protein
MIASNGPANDNIVVSMAKSVVGMGRAVDDMIGSPVQTAVQMGIDAASSNGLLDGLIPDAGEFSGKIRRTISDNQKGDILAGLSKEKSYFSEHTKALENYLAVGDSVGWDFNNEVLQKAAKTDKFDFSGFGNEERVIKDIANPYIAKNREAMNSLDMHMNTVRDGGYYMDNQNIVEKMQTYFSNPQYGDKRLTTAGIGTAALLVGGRYASGGDLTHDADGRRDIVGVPFI